MDLSILYVLKHIFIAIFLSDIIFVSVDCFVPAALVILALLSHVKASHLEYLGDFVFISLVISIWSASNDRMHQILGC